VRQDRGIAGVAFMPSSIACLKLAPAGLLLACVVVAPAHADRAAFIDEHRCAVTERLERIHARGNRATSKDRFLAISTMWRGTPQAYVQCIFFANDTKMYCEAPSGFYERKPEERGVAPVPDLITAIAALGYSTDPSEGNFSQEIDLGDPPNVSRAAAGSNTGPDEPVPERAAPSDLLYPAIPLGGSREVR
jgi:hypothetical protein